MLSVTFSVAIIDDYFVALHHNIYQFVHFCPLSAIILDGTDTTCWMMLAYKICYEICECCVNILWFRQEIRTSTSSMTSVPKPLKFLRPHYGTLKTYYETMEDSELKV